MTSSPASAGSSILASRTTVNIALARERLGKLGFTVAADARHPLPAPRTPAFSFPTRPIWSP